jgi:hypothetical protein
MDREQAAALGFQLAQIVMAAGEKDKAIKIIKKYC